jgi:hypothetical protein
MPSVVRNIPSAVRGKHPFKWRLIDVYINDPKKGIISVNAKVLESYLCSNINVFLVGCNIELVIPIEGPSKGFARARKIGDDSFLIYNWEFLSSQEFQEEDYIKKYKPNSLSRLIKAYLNNYRSELSNSFEHLKIPDKSEVFCNTVDREFDATFSENMFSWWTDNDEYEYSSQYEFFLMFIASKWGFSEFRTQVRSLMEYEGFEDKLEIKKEIIGNSSFYEQHEYYEEHEYNHFYFRNKEEFSSGYKFNDFYNDQLDLDQQDPEFYDNL